MSETVVLNPFMSWTEILNECYTDVLKLEFVEKSSMYYISGSLYTKENNTMMNLIRQFATAQNKNSSILYQEAP